MELGAARIGIVGLGLMGASLAKKLTASGTVRRVTGWDRDGAVRHLARSQGVAEVPEGLEKLGSESDVLIFAVPWRFLADADRAVRRGLAKGGQTMWAVMDLCSAKRAPGELLKRSWGGRYVGFHPMAGKERGGIIHATAELFSGAPCAIVSYPDTAPEVSSFAARLATALGMGPVEASPEDHDAAVAVVSHLPQLLASALALVAGEEARRNPLGARLAGGGFRDTTRVASCPAEGGADLVSANGDHLRRGIRRLIQILEEFLSLPEEALEERLRAAASAREEILTIAAGRSAA